MTGHDNTALGDYSMAVGRRARVNHNSSAVIALSEDEEATCESTDHGTLNIWCVCVSVCVSIVAAFVMAVLLLW